MAHEIISNNLISIHIIEKVQNHYLFTWTYPTISDSDRIFVEWKLCLICDNNFLYFNHSSKWIYLLNSENFFFCLITKQFDPQKYYQVCNYFIVEYLKSRSPVNLVRLFIEFVKCAPLVTENHSIELKSLVQEFNLEIILLYTGLLLKKRIIVYHKNIGEVQKALYLFCKLMDYHNPSLFVLPFVDNLEKVQGKSFFLAGVTKNFSKEEQYYDLYVNLLTKEINVSSHAKSVFTMCKIHKEVAVSLVKLSENEETSDKELIEEASKKTKEIHNYLQKFVNVKTEKTNMITIESLRERKMNSNIENFIFNLAIAENMMVL